MPYLPGDILLFSGRGPVSWLIRVLTLSPYSHVGIVSDVSKVSLGKFDWVSMFVLQEWKDGLRLFESTSLDDVPCEITGKRIAGTQAHRVEDTVKRYRGRVWRMRLNTEYKLSVRESWSLTEHLLESIGKIYDTENAALSGTRWIKGCSFNPDNRNAMYCVEYAADGLRQTFKQSMKWVLALATLDPGRMTPTEFAHWAARSGLYGRPERVK
jgi:hypothetical protein